jgi:hypothetical protein
MLLKKRAFRKILLLGMFTFAAIFIFSIEKSYACPPLNEACMNQLFANESGGDCGIMNQGSNVSVNQSGAAGLFQYIESALAGTGWYTGGTNQNCGNCVERDTGDIDGDGNTRECFRYNECDWDGTFTPPAGYEHITSLDAFLADCDAQKAAYEVYTQNNWQTLVNNGALDVLGTTAPNGEIITCEGLLMAAHISGPGGAMAYAEGRGNADDGGGSAGKYFADGSACSNGVLNSTTPTQYESCSAEILSVGAQLSESRMQVEKQQIDEAISKPQNVAEMSCIEQFGEMFNREIGAIFGNTDGDDISGVGLEIFNFDGIFTQTQAAINQQINNAINNGLLGGRGLNIGGAITDTLNSMLGGISGGSGNVNFTCEAMNLLWEIMQCQDIFDFKIPSLKDLMGDFSLSGLLSDIMPDSCAGQVLTEAALERAGTVFSSFDQTLAEAISPATIEGVANSY